MGGISTEGNVQANLARFQSMQQGVALREGMREAFGSSFSDNQLPLRNSSDVRGLFGITQVQAMGAGRFVSQYIVGDSGIKFRVEQGACAELGRQLGLAARADLQPNAARRAEANQALEQLSAALGQAGAPEAVVAVHQGYQAAQPAPPAPMAPPTEGLRARCPMLVEPSSTGVKSCGSK